MGIAHRNLESASNASISNSNGGDFQSTHGCRVIILRTDGILFLRGRLFGFHETQVAQEVVAAIDGVTQVVNEIQVE